ncbi:MAG: tetratricopeptide repeat protein [Bacteroidia bacterium]|jgi:tetratricopeptide (TPR) repeat protein|nr:tetratricopeptide repeat protein [Bacteroidia bacterium]
MKIFRLILLLTLVLTTAPQAAFCQPVPPQTVSPDEQLAGQYYSAGEYDKALVYYEKLYDRNPIAIYYNYYLNCLIQTKNFRKAEKVVTRQSKRYPLDLRFRVDMARVYRAQGDEDKAKKEFNAAINAITQTTSATAVIDLANAFLGLNETQFAVDALKRGRREMGERYNFGNELAEVYYLRKEYALMVNECLDMAAQNPSGERQQVQNRLQAWMDEDREEKVEPALRTELLRRSQKEPDNLIWSEMLMWLFMQQKDFRAAMVQAKAIDKRRKTDGTNVMELAAVARFNEEYDAAISGYDYVIGLGPGGGNYRKARTDRVTTRSEQITARSNYTRTELLQLETEMKTTLTELGEDGTTIDLMRSLAHLQAFYLFKTGEAVQLLEKAIALPGVNPEKQAESKLELGDVLLLDGQVWEASLRYSQVEKAFKRETVGQEAKYRNAKVAFYIGDFKWSQVQLNVLKGSTSKLISNDAMYLSILITDNFALDSNPEPLNWFAQADLMLFQNRFDLAGTYLDSIDRMYSTHSIADDVLFLRYRIAMKQQNWTEAGKQLDKLLSMYSDDVLGDDALFRLAELYEFHLDDKAKAMECYQKLLTQFPGSLFVVDARKRYRELRGDKVAD